MLLPESEAAVNEVLFFESDQSCKDPSVESIQGSLLDIELVRHLHLWSSVQRDHATAAFRGLSSSELFRNCA